MRERPGPTPHLVEDGPTGVLREVALAGDVVEQVVSSAPLHHDVEAVPGLVPVLDGGQPGDVPHLLQDHHLQGHVLIAESHLAPRDFLDSNLQSVGLPHSRIHLPEGSLPNLLVPLVETPVERLIMSNYNLLMTFLN